MSQACDQVHQPPDILTSPVDTSNMKLTSRFGKNLRWHRNQAGLSQEELAALVGIHRTEVSLFERGEREPRLEMLIKLADSLKVAIGELSAGITWKSSAGTGKKQSTGRFKITQSRPGQRA